MACNVLSWSRALQVGLPPSGYSYESVVIPKGEINALLDYKVWAKKVMAISCYFSDLQTGIRFQLTVYHKTGLGYRIAGSDINFACCPTGKIYHLRIEENTKGKPVIMKAELVE